jgi:hypothetical protein
MEEKRNQRIAIYTGRGVSHSWIWFAEILDRLCFFDIRFISEKDIRGNILDAVDLLLISGGDTFAIAEALEEDSEKVAGFIKDGGIYIGVCAGAYLPLKSSKAPLSAFNLVDARVNNLSKMLPEAKTMGGESIYKYCTPYGCHFIYHPVRGPVKIKINGRSLVAPLYGGPAMLPTDGVETLAYYTGFTDETLFIVDKELAKDTLLGKVAALKKKYGKGSLYLFGPHFEHPLYPNANQVIADLVKLNPPRNTLDRSTKSDKQILNGTKKNELLNEIKREISNSRIVSYSIELSPVAWKIGQKVWEPEKISYFLDAIWKRIKYLESNDELVVEDVEEIVELAKTTTKFIREVKKEIKNGGRFDSPLVNRSIELAEDMFSSLIELTSMFLDVYFEAKRKSFIYRECII